MDFCIGMTGLVIWNLIFWDIYKGSLEYFEIHLYIKVIYIRFILFINEDK